MDGPYNTGYSSGDVERWLRQQNQPLSNIVNRPSLSVMFGVDPSATSRVRDMLGRFMHFDESAKIYTETNLGFAAAMFTARLRKEFEAGTDKLGRSHNKTGWTLRTIRIHLDGKIAVVEMGGGGVFVEYGRGEVQAQPGHYLHWVDPDGGQVFRKSVGPARADDFVGRAMETTNLQRLLDRVAYGVFSDMTGHAVDARGIQYSGGQTWQAYGYFKEVAGGPISSLEAGAGATA